MTSSMHLAARGSEGFSLQRGFNTDAVALLKHEKGGPNPAACRVMSFSKDGAYFAYCDNANTRVVEVETGADMLDLPFGRTSQLAFSPKNTVFCTFEPYATYGANKTEQPGPNLRMYDLKSGQLLAQLIQKRMQGWCPQWSEDESVCCRLVGSELLFHNDNYEKYSNKLVVPKLADYSLSCGEAPYHVACYTPGGKGQPAVVRVYVCDGKFGTVANKTFWKADRVSMEWNPKGNALIVMAITDVDSTGKSYYGEQNLYLVRTDGESCLVPLAKNGPVYSIAWSPHSTHFCCVYGYMPAKATLYNQRGEPVFDFGIGPRNEVYYNPFGNIILICGFGNLAGNMEFWSANERKLICKIQVPNTTQFEWAPDGQHFVTATTTPRLREDNGYKIWHYSGKLLAAECLEKGQELWEVRWRPDKSHKGFKLKYLTAAEQATAGLANIEGQSSAFESLPGGAISKGVYVPPHLRGKQAVPNKRMTENIPAPAVVSGLSETEKKIRNVQKKIDQIKNLKEKQKAGVKLELNQLSKIEKEHELIAELERLQVS